MAKNCKGVILIFNFQEEISKYNLTLEQYDNCISDIFNKVKNIEDIDWAEIVERYNLPIAKDTLRKASSQSIFGSVFVYEYLKYKEENVNKDIPVINTKQVTTLNADRTETSESQFFIEDESKLRDYDYLLQLHNYDPRLFEIVSAKNSKWNSGDRTLYSSKITVKPKKTDILLEDIELWFERLSKNYSKPKVQHSEDYLSGDKLLLIDISDLHMNLSASMYVTGNTYNCDVAEELFFYVINDVLSRTKHYKFNKIIFTIGGDALNADNILGTTTNGTSQSNDLHLFDAYNRLHDMTIRAIDMLKDIAPVEVIHIASNHDFTASWKLAKCIYAWFRNEDRVKVDTSPLPRKYVVFGKTLFVFAHDAKVKELPALISDEAREYWSSVDFAEVMLQHLHSEQVLMESHNIRIQRLPTISANSGWAVENGYGSKRQCKSFIYDKEDGITDVIYTPIKQK